MDREDAARKLASALLLMDVADPIVLALPRGGVPIGAVVAQTLGAPLDLLIVRKLGAPNNPEFAFGALGEGDVLVLDEPSINAWGITTAMRDQVIAEADREIQRRVERYRGGRSIRALRNHAAIIVDDGLATGATAEAAVRVARKMGATPILLAVPTGSREAVDRLSPLCDHVLCLEIPEWFGSVGAQYHVFPQVTDDEVCAFLHE